MWTNSGSPPWELVSYVLRRDVYHCLPAELDEADWADIQADLAVRAAIAEVEKADNR